MKKVLTATAIFLLSVSLAITSEAAAASPKTFRDCASCPEMVVIPAGAFAMGSPATEVGRSDDEGPQHRVTIAHPFALARYDVTRAEFEAFAAATHVASDSKCDRRDPKAHGQSIGQRGDEPVVCVNWSDASAYVAWLSSRTSKSYRLPSEAEWEYAARAGTTTARPWGDQVSRDHANYGSDACCGAAKSGADRWLYTSPVGSFPPNAWGLSDMLGNVWQWTEDCAQDYAHAPIDGSPAKDGDCSRRMLRGGAWFQAPESERSAARANDDQKFRAADIGFRVARDLAN